MKNLSATIILIFILNSSCSTLLQPQKNSSIELIEQTKNEIAQSAKSFEGQHKSILLKAWGAPKSKTDDGLGGEIYYYTQSVKITDGTLAIYINMFVNKEGKVYSSTVKHLLI